MKKTEKVLAVLFGIGILFKLLLWDGSDIMTIIGGMLLSILYWPFGFALLNGIRGRHLFARSAYADRTTGQLILAGSAGLAFATACVATVFCVQHWAGGGVLWVVGLGCLLLVAGLMLALRERLRVPGGWLIRCIILLIVLIAASLPPLSIPSRQRLAATPTALP